MRFALLMTLMLLAYQSTGAQRVEADVGALVRVSVAPGLPSIKGTLSAITNETIIVSRDTIQKSSIVFIEKSTGTRRTVKRGIIIGSITGLVVSMMAGAAVNGSIQRKPGQMAVRGLGICAFTTGIGGLIGWGNQTEVWKAATLRQTDSSVRPDAYVSNQRAAGDVRNSSSDTPPAPTTRVRVGLYLSANAESPGVATSARPDFTSIAEYFRPTRYTKSTSRVPSRQ